MGDLDTAAPLEVPRAQAWHGLRQAVEALEQLFQRQVPTGAGPGLPQDSETHKVSFLDAVLCMSDALPLAFLQASHAALSVRVGRRLSCIDDCSQPCHAACDKLRHAVAGVVPGHQAAGHLGCQRPQ